MMYKVVKSKCCDARRCFKLGTIIWNDLAGVLGVDGKAIYVDINNAYARAAKYKGGGYNCQGCAAEVQEEE